MTLITRLFHHGNSSSHSSSSNHTCPAQATNDPPQVPFVSNLSFQQFSEILSGVCLGVCCLSTFFLVFRHATNYTVPKEQKQIIRLILLVPIFSLVSFLCILSPTSSVYILPVGDFYESLAFAAMFLLLCTYIHTAQPHARVCTPVQALKILQFPAVMLLVLVITEISQAAGVYCETETKVYFAKIWIVILKSLSTILAFITLLPLFKQHAPLLRTLPLTHSPLTQLLSIKGIVFLDFVQTILFSFLNPHLSPTNKLTTLDITNVIPRLVFSLEMVIFAGVFLWVYGVGGYVARGGRGKGGVLGWKALAQALNVVGFAGEMVREVRGGERGGVREELGMGGGGKYESVGLTVRSEETV